VTSQFKSPDDVYAFLNNIPMFSDKGQSAANFSLDGIRELCKQLGNPQDEFTSIHVAGTNGKGTTCRMLASVYQSAGYRTGLFTSPHLINYRERMTVNSEWIKEKDLLRFFQGNEEIIREMKPTYFELATAIGFWYFRDERVDVAIIETGLGGRLDATNIIQPVASVITSVGLDHTEILGDTIEEISREKAGIIQPKTPVVTGNLNLAALAEVEHIADQLDAPLIKSSEISLETDLEKQPLVAKINGRIVEAVVQVLSDKLPVSSQDLTDGLKKWMGRFPTGTSFRRVHSDYPWYFDGAHNTDALKLLKQQMKEIAPLSSWSFVFAMMKDKLTSEVVSELSEIGALYYHPLKLKRAATENEVRTLLPNAIILQADNSLPKSWVQKNKSELVIFGGSFYFYTTLMQWINNIVDC